MNKEVPTIIIGLGGIGSEIVAQAEHLLQGCDKTGRFEDYKRGNVRFVIVDTDINSIRERERCGYKGYSVRLSDNISVSSCLDKDQDARLEWFPNNKKYYSKSIAEGAGQIRSISRLVLQRAIRIGRLAPLYKAIEDLYRNNGNMNEQELKIAVVTTIAGGTGSGVVLPLGIHIKDYLNRTYSGAGAKINAFFIMPEVLYDVIPSKEEKRNLNANGYATIKEIDALINGNSSKMSIVLPNESDHSYKAFVECPFDFCFLFNKLSSQKTVYGNIEDYKNVITRCLYTQFLGNLAPEYFSKEENVLASHVREVNRKEYHYERFAGAGCAILRYPVEEISEYLSLCWMSDIMKEEWGKYDVERQEIRRRDQQRQELGEIVPLLSEGEAFLKAVTVVDQREKEEKKSPWTCEERQKIICEQKSVNGMWVELEKYIKFQIQEKRSGLVQQIEDIKDVIGHVRGRRERRDYLESCIALETELRKENEEIHKDLCDSLDRQICCVHIGERKPYYIEYYLTDHENEFESPNYIRFVLYTLEREGAVRKEELEQKLESLRRQVESSLERGKEVTGRLTKGCVVSRIENQCTAYEDMCELLEKQIECYLVSEVLKYIRKISESYERFFGEYSRILTLISRRKSEMERRFQTTVLKMEHWVYASNKYLQKRHEQMKLKKAYYAVGGDISEWLYMDNLQKANMDIREDAVKQYENLKEKWEIQFGRYYHDNMNVLKALQEEAKEETGQVDIGYMRKRLESARDSASIQITSCRRPYVTSRDYCIYPVSLEEMTDSDEIIQEFLKNGKSCPDFNGLDVDDKKLVFFKIGYGFLPLDVDFFTDDPGICAEYPAGSGIQSYRWTMEHFCNKSGDVQITPHIDRRWHRSEFMNVNWRSRFYTSFIATVLWRIYAEVIMKSEKDGKTDTQQEIWQKLEEYYRKHERENIRMLYITLDKLKAMKGQWIKKEAKKNAENATDRIYLLHKEILEKWCSGKEGHFEVDLEEDFLGFLEKLDDNSGEWARRYNKAWEKSKNKL